MCNNSFAHQYSDEYIQKHKDKEVQAIAKLTRILHQAIEGQKLHVHSLKDFFKVFRNKEQWVQLLNFHRTTRRTVRAFNMESSKKNLTNHVKNLALLFPLSHFTEVAAAPTFISIGTVHEFPSVVVGFGSSLLSIVAVPGLDPLCILLIASYPLRPVHRSVDFIRRFAEKSIKGTAAVLKLNTLLSKTHTYEDRFNFIKKEFERKKKFNRIFDLEWDNLTEGNRLSLSNKADGKKVLSLKRAQDSETNQFYLESLWISKTATQDLRSVLNLLSWNARSAVRELLKIKDDLKKVQSYEREFFVDQIDFQASGIEVRYKAKAISLGDKFQFKKVFKRTRLSDCQSVFQQSH